MKVGSSLDSQIWYEPYQARKFKLFMKTDLLRSFLIKEARSATFSGSLCSQIQCLSLQNRLECFCILRCL